MGFIGDSKYLEVLTQSVRKALASNEFTINPEVQSISLSLENDVICQMIDYHNLASSVIMIDEDTMTTILIVRTDDQDVRPDIGEDMWVTLLNDTWIYATVSKLLEIE